MKNTVLVVLLCVVLFTGCEQLLSNTGQKLDSSAESVEELNNSLVLLDKDYPELTNKQKLIIEKLSREGKLGLLSLEAMEVVNRYFKIVELDKKISSFKDNYVELNEEEDILINELEGCDKLYLLSESSQKIWSNFKIIRENLPTNMTISGLKKLNADLSGKEVYGNLTEEELKLVENLNRSNKLNLLLNEKSIKVAKAGLKLKELDRTLTSLDSNSKEYPELNNEQKKLLRDIESNNKLSSLSRIAQQVWKRSKEIEVLPAGVSIGNLKKLNADLSGKEVYGDLTEEELKLVENLNRINKLNLLNLLK